MKPVILLYRTDLRLADHPALSAAAQTGAPVLPLYIYDEKIMGDRAPGGASRWWLHHSLAALSKATGGALVLRRGDTVNILREIIEDTGAKALYFTRGYAAHQRRQEDALQDGLDIELRRFGGGLLFEPESVKTGGGDPYKVFTPFWRSCLERDEPKQPLDMPRDLRWHSDTRGDDLDDWGFLPTRPDWAGGLREAWTPGEDGAQARLDVFLKDTMRDYKEMRDRPDVEGTSRLSPHLRFGEISPRQIWRTAKLYAQAHPETRQGCDAFLREVGWREFSTHLLFHRPDLHRAAFKPEYDDIEWEDDANDLTAWRKGMTGFPLIDAGMRELWTTGWMHNRVRMVVASLLVKNMLIDWRDGERWFWDTLVDADDANNAASWQWVAGSGADAAPYFRVFNPVLQSKKFDPDGAYIRRWAPELKDMPDTHIHAPFDAPDSVLAAAGVTLGTDYPEPVVDLKATRKRALERYAAATKKDG